MFIHRGTGWRSGIFDVAVQTTDDAHIKQITPRARGNEEDLHERHDKAWGWESQAG